MTSRFLHGPTVDQVFAQEDNTGNTLWSLSDNQGTVRDIADYNASTNTTTIKNHRKFNTYGTITSESNATIDFRYAYTGRFFDQDIDLQYNRARWYDATTGRFLSEDPLNFTAGDTNVSRYVNNGPTNYIDPSGLQRGGRRTGRGRIRNRLFPNQIPRQHRYFGNVPPGFRSWREYDFFWRGSQRRGRPQLSRAEFAEYMRNARFRSRRANFTVSGAVDEARRAGVPESEIRNLRYESFVSRQGSRFNRAEHVARRLRYAAQQRIQQHDNIPQTLTPGRPKYYELDSLGRPQGVMAIITRREIRTGTGPRRSIRPPGFGGGTSGHARGHLLGRQLGGSGADARNIVTMFQNRANHPIMSGFERRVRRAVEAGESVFFIATPNYRGNQSIPHSITIIAGGNQGFSLYVTIINIP